MDNVPQEGRGGPFHRLLLGEGGGGLGQAPQRLAGDGDEVRPVLHEAWCAGADHGKGLGAAAGGQGKEAEGVHRALLGRGAVRIAERG